MGDILSVMRGKREDRSVTPCNKWRIQNTDSGPCARKAKDNTEDPGVPPFPILLVRRQISRPSFRIDGTQSARGGRDRIRAFVRSFKRRKRTFNGETEMRRRRASFPRGRGKESGSEKQGDRRKEGNCGSRIRASMREIPRYFR